MPSLLLLLGPTAVGKTAVAMSLADLLGEVQLISVDSAMVYRGLDIGTAKPDADELARYPHELIDISEPAQPYSAADFVRDADAAVRRAWQRRQLPVLVGGTMLYAKCFLEGIAPLPSADAALRAALQQELNARGGEALHQELAQIDPLAARQIHPNNPQRLLRALEVTRLTGEPMSHLWQRAAGDDVQQRLGAQVHTLGMLPQQRSELHQRIDARFQNMLQCGFLQEVRQLRQNKLLHADLPSMRAVGYRQAWQHLDGAIDYDTFCANALTATRRLAKRQLTWMRRLPISENLPWQPPMQIAQHVANRLTVSFD